jgi:hypothetical protein
LNLFFSSAQGQSLPIFRDPDKACNLLQSEGFATAEWHAEAFGYECSSTNRKVDYQVTGDDRLRAKRLKVMLNLKYESGDPATRRTEFDRIAMILLTRIGLKAPPELHKAILTTRQFRQAQQGAKITFDPGRPPFRRQTLIIRDSAIRVVTIPRSP